MSLAVVAIFKNEARYLAEWLAFHLVSGVERFYLYNNESSDNWEQVVGCFDDVVDLVEWRSVEGQSPQLSAYAHAIGRSLPHEFVAFIDLDEFLVPTGERSILRVLSDLPADCGGVAVSQRVFGSSGQEQFKADLVTRRFTNCAVEGYIENSWVKSIYREKCVSYIGDCHFGQLSTGRYLHPNGDVVDFATEAGVLKGRASKIELSALQLNHYIIKSREEFGWKRSRGGGMGSTVEARLSRYADDAFFHGRDRYINAVGGMLAPKTTQDLIAEIMRRVGRDKLEAIHLGALMDS